MKEMRPGWAALDPAVRGTLSAQLAANIRRKVSIGELKPGDRLPGVRELASICGTSVRVPIAAFAALARDGVVASRPRVGTVVLGQKRRAWHGRVLMLRNCVCPDYVGMALREEIAVALARASWRVEFASVPHVRNRNSPDVAAFKRELAEKPDFAVLCFGNAATQRAVERRGVPYATLDGSLPLGRNQVVNVVWSYDRAVAEFAADCGRKGVGGVFALHITSMHYLGMEEALAKRGVPLETMVVKPRLSIDRLESFRECGYRAVKNRLAKGARPELVFFADDYLAVGGLWALAEAGLKIPDDVKVVTVANRNNVPFHPGGLTRIEWDQCANGAKISRALLKYLEAGVQSGNMFIAPRYVRGGTF